MSHAIFVRLFAEPGNPNLELFTESEIKAEALAGVAQLVGASSHKLKGHRFDSRSEHTPEVRVQSLVGACMRGNQSVFFSHIGVSPLLFFPPFPSL